MPVFLKNIRSVVFPCSVENHFKYMCNYFIMFCAKSLIKLCLRAPNNIFNVFPPNICQCLQWLLQNNDTNTYFLSTQIGNSTHSTSTALFLIHFKLITAFSGLLWCRLSSLRVDQNSSCGKKWLDIDYQPIFPQFFECDQNWMSSRIPSRFSAQLSTTEFSQLKSCRELGIK